MCKIALQEVRRIFLHVTLTAIQVADLRRRVAAGEPKAALARTFGISRETLYQYLKREA
jgi:DNA-binding phage protein